MLVALPVAPTVRRSEIVPFIPSVRVSRPWPDVVDLERPGPETDCRIVDFGMLDVSTFNAYVAQQVSGTAVRFELRP